MTIRVNSNPYVAEILHFYDFLYLSVSKACRKLENTCKLSHQKSLFLLRFSAAHGLRDEDGGAGTYLAQAVSVDMSHY